MSKTFLNKCQHQAEGNIEGLRETCFAIPPNSKLEKTEKKTFVLHRCGVLGTSLHPGNRRKRGC